MKFLHDRCISLILARHKPEIIALRGHTSMFLGGIFLGIHEWPIIHET
jgi:hypothetical protein